MINADRTLHIVYLLHNLHFTHKSTQVYTQTIRMIVYIQPTMYVHTHTHHTYIHVYDKYTAVTRCIHTDD